MIFAQIIDCKVHCIREYEEVPNFHANAGVFIDITDSILDIREGCDCVDGVFHEYVEPDTPNYLILTLSVNGPGFRNLTNDGSDTIALSGLLKRESDDTIIQLSGTWYIPLRSSFGGVYDIATCSFIDGMASVVYSTTLAPEIVSFEQYDMIPVTIDGVVYEIKLEGRNKFMVHR